MISSDFGSETPFEVTVSTQPMYFNNYFKIRRTNYSSLLNIKTLMVFTLANISLQTCVIITATCIVAYRLPIVQSWKWTIKARGGRANQDIEQMPGAPEENTTYSKSCKPFIVLLFRNTKKQILYQEVYPMLILTLKYILTLAVFQVASQRCFFNFKYNKNPLLNTLSEYRLEALEQQIDVLNRRQNRARIIDLGRLRTPFPKKLCQLYFSSC